MRCLAQLMLTKLKILKLVQFYIDQSFKIPFNICYEFIKIDYSLNSCIDSDPGTG